MHIKEFLAGMHDDLSVKVGHYKNFFLSRRGVIVHIFLKIGRMNKICFKNCHFRLDAMKRKKFLNRS